MPPTRNVSTIHRKCAKCKRQRLMKFLEVIPNEDKRFCKVTVQTIVTVCKDSVKCAAYIQKSKTKSKYA
jgi:hypothetical protein